MQKWQHAFYTIVGGVVAASRGEGSDPKREGQSLDYLLTSLGYEGWELVAAVPIGGRIADHRLFFKRPQ